MTEPEDVAETRTAYDTVAASYADLVDGALADSPMDRALLGVLAEGGYRLEALRAFDCFPMTAHVECVALLVPAG